MRTFGKNNFSRGEMKSVLGGLLPNQNVLTDCYCLKIHGEPTTAGYGCVTFG
jgi:hypothetical protein